LVHETLHESSNKKRHGRQESRTYIQFEIPEDFAWFGSPDTLFHLYESVSIPLRN
jgi:hypothetical protein